MHLTVGNLPNNRLALTNQVYISANTYTTLSQTAASGLRANTILITVNEVPYVAVAHADIPVESIGMNGLQRRTAKLAVSSRVFVDAFVPPGNFALGSITYNVNLLSKKQQSSSSGQRVVKELDTNQLAQEVLLNYEGQVFGPGMVLALSFEGSTLEISVDQVELLDLGGDDDVVPMHLKSMGQLLGPTEILFQKVKGSQLVALNGDKIAGSAGGASNIFLSDFDFEKLGIGGLNAEFNEIFRRAFASRIFPAHITRSMGINHIRGMLLYGPPGCGKTLIARQIGKVLNAREPKIVNGPEILNKYVGGSEEKIRELFAEAEIEQKEAGDTSMLHIIILDEMDAICKQRGSVKDGTGVSDSVVNQLLSKIDGVDSLNNILLIGMTNRKDMIDDALLRPGRLEVHVEIGLPDEHGRLQVLNIHTKLMRENNRINSEALDRMGEIATKSKNFSGAELEGLVKSASSYAFTRCVDVNDLSKVPDANSLRVEFSDFERALNEVEPKFGAKNTELKALYRNGIVNYGNSFDLLTSTLSRLVEQVRTSEKTPLMSVLLEGPAHSGKTAIAAKLAVDSGFPFVRVISADEMIGYSDSSKCHAIHKAFMDSYKSPLSLIFIDDIERIIDYVNIGPRFSNTVLQTLLVLLKKIPPDEGRRLMVLGTTSVPHLLEDLGLSQAFSVSQHVGLLDQPEWIQSVLRTSANVAEKDAISISNAISKPIGIKQLLMVAEMAIHGGLTEEQGEQSTSVNTNVFLECLHNVGY